MEFYQIKVQYGQSIYDIAMQHYASVSYVYFLMADNPLVVISLDVVLPIGTVLNIRTEPTLDARETMLYYRRNNVEVNTNN